MDLKKIILAPDSFKGTLSSREICRVMRRVINELMPDCEVISVPIADGGEGTVDCLLEAIGGERVALRCMGPFGGEIEAQYGILSGGDTAVIEMAAAAGLPLAYGREDPTVTTTFGVGQLIADAAAKGCKKIILGLGGSCTNDFGCGAAAALGVRFFDTLGKEFIPVGGTLCDVERIDVNSLSLPKGVGITLMCDIDNPVYGQQGAAYVFAPQKGADKAAVEHLDDGLRHICAVVQRQLGLDVSALPGGGAAGAMGAGMFAFAGAEICPGIDTILAAVDLDGMLAGAQLVITGEGKLDRQSIRGKVVSGIARRAKAAGVQAIAIVGGADEGTEEMYSLGISAVFSINRMPVDFEISRYSTAENIAFTLKNILMLTKGLK